ncbi:MAG: glycosyl hydrolase 108 family protein [Bacteroidota bacterium]
MTDRFNKLIPFILKAEGGFVNDPDDDGGATKMGVSLRYLKSLGHLEYDLDHDGDIDIEDIRRITPEIARQIYYERFYVPLQLEGLSDEKLALQVLDHAVYAGTRSAVKILQHVSGCKEDGLMGPKTIAAANTFKDNISLRYQQGRFLFYEDLVEAKSKFAKFLPGWMNRVKHIYETACQF